MQMKNMLCRGAIRRRRKIVHNECAITRLGTFVCTQKGCNNVATPWVSIPKGSGNWPEIIYVVLPVVVGKKNVIVDIA